MHNLLLMTNLLLSILKVLLHLILLILNLTTIWRGLIIVIIIYKIGLILRCKARSIIIVLNGLVLLQILVWNVLSILIHPLIVYLIAWIILHAHIWHLLLNLLLFNVILIYLQLLKLLIWLNLLLLVLLKFVFIECFEAWHHPYILLNRITLTIVVLVILIHI